MVFKARLNLRYYIVSVIMLLLVVFVWYGIYFLNSNEILMEDNTPMNAEIKSVLTVLMSVVAVSWTISLLILIRQMFLGCAFSIDEDGIRNTATANLILAFIFVVPVKRIPYNAIQQISEEHGILTIRIDKSRIQTLPILKLFIRKDYHFFLGFTKEKTENIKAALNGFMQL